MRTRWLASSNAGLRNVGFGRGDAGPLPGDVGSGAVTVPGGVVEFDSRGLTFPFGAKGGIYLVHERDPQAVAAVSVSGAASFRVWSQRDGVWR